MSVEFVEQCGVELVDSLASDDMVAMAAWVSFDDDKKERLGDRDGIAKLIKFLYRNKHMSPFEHGTFIFKVDVPLFVAREFHRHRTMSYNEVSGRYVKMEPRFYLPRHGRPLIQDGKPGDYFFVEGTDEQYAIATSIIRNGTRDAYRAYERMLERGIAKEVARMVLPVNTMTQFYATVNPRNLMQFLTLRNESHALDEIQDVARKMEAHLAEQMPLTYAAFRGTPTAPDDVPAPLPPVRVSANRNGPMDRNINIQLYAEPNAVQQSFERRKHVLT